MPVNAKKGTLLRSCCCDRHVNYLSSQSNEQFDAFGRNTLIILNVYTLAISRPKECPGIQICDLSLDGRHKLIDIKLMYEMPYR